MKTEWMMGKRVTRSVPIPINFRNAEIGAVRVAINKKKIMTRAVSVLTLCFFLVSQIAYSNPGAGIEIAARREMPGFLRIDIPSELATLDGLYEAPPRQDPKLILHIQNAHANYGAQQKIKQLLQYLEKQYAIKTIFVEGASEDLNPDYLKMFPDRERNLKLAEFLAKQGELTGAELYLLENAEDDGRRMADGEKKQEGGRRKADGEKTGFPLSSILHPPSAILGAKRRTIHHPPSGSAVRAHGIETADLYRENYEALKKVFGAEITVKRYLSGFEGRLSTLASKVFSKDLLRLLGEWKKFEKGRREFMPYVKSLAAEAKRVLGVDLESLLSQIEWPQITRLLVLQTMEKELDMQKGLAERDRLIEFLKEKKVSPKLISGVENFQDQQVTVLQGTQSGSAASVEPRDLMEQLVTEAGPKGFYFYNYPNFSLYAGYLILKSEMDPKGLFNEIKVLFDKILDKLAETEKSDGGWRRADGVKTGLSPSALRHPISAVQSTAPSTIHHPPSSLQKALLELYRNEELVRKLLNLELTRKDWQEVLAKKDLLAMDPLVAELKEIGTAVSRESGLPLSNFETKPVNPQFRREVMEAQAAAYGFYEAARKREDVFYEKIDAVMKKESLSKAVLITGGFHTDGITELLREHEISYGTLTPRLSEKSDENLYRNVMLQNKPSTFELSYLEAVLSHSTSPSAADKQVSGASLNAFWSELRGVEAVIGSIKKNLPTLNASQSYMKRRAEIREIGPNRYQIIRTETRTPDTTPGVEFRGGRGNTLGVGTAVATGLSGVLATRAEIRDALTGIAGKRGPGQPDQRILDAAAKFTEMGIRAEQRVATNEVGTSSGLLTEAAVRAEVRQLAKETGQNPAQVAANVAQAMGTLPSTRSETRSRMRKFPQPLKLDVKAMAEKANCEYLKNARGDEYILDKNGRTIFLFSDNQGAGFETIYSPLTRSELSTEISSWPDKTKVIALKLVEILELPELLSAQPASPIRGRPSDLPEDHFVNLGPYEARQRKQEQWESVKNLDDNDPRKVLYFRRFTSEFTSSASFDLALIRQSNPFQYYVLDHSKYNQVGKVEPYRTSLSIPEGVKIGFVIGYHDLEKPWGNLFIEMWRRQVQYKKGAIEFIIIQNKDIPTGARSRRSVEEIRTAVFSKGITHIIDVHEELSSENYYADDPNATESNVSFRIDGDKNPRGGEYTFDPIIPLWAIEQYYQGYIYPQLQYAINEQIKKVEILIKNLGRSELRTKVHSETRVTPPEGDVNPIQPPTVESTEGSRASFLGVPAGALAEQPSDRRSEARQPDSENKSEVSEQGLKKEVGSKKKRRDWNFGMTAEAFAQLSKEEKAAQVYKIMQAAASDPGSYINVHLDVSRWLVSLASGKFQQIMPRFDNGRNLGETQSFGAKKKLSQIFLEGIERREDGRLYLKFVYTTQNGTPGTTIVYWDEKEGMYQSIGDEKRADLVWKIQEAQRTGKKFEGLRFEASDWLVNLTGGTFQAIMPRPDGMNLGKTLGIGAATNLRQIFLEGIERREDGRLYLKFVYTTQNGTPGTTIVYWDEKEGMYQSIGDEKRADLVWKIQETLRTGKKFEDLHLDVSNWLVNLARGTFKPIMPRPDGMNLSKQLGFGAKKKLSQIFLEGIERREDGRLYLKFTYTTQNGTPGTTIVYWDEEEETYRDEFFIKRTQLVSWMQETLRTGKKFENLSFEASDRLVNLAEGTFQAIMPRPDGMNLNKHLGFGAVANLRQIFLEGIERREDGRLYLKFAYTTQNGTPGTTIVYWDEEEETYRDEFFIKRTQLVSWMQETLRTGKKFEDLNFEASDRLVNLAEGTFQKIMPRPDGTNLGKTLGIGAVMNLSQIFLEGIEKREDERLYLKFVYVDEDENPGWTWVAWDPSKETYKVVEKSS